jgi:hypothetical protein
MTYESGGNPGEGSNLRSFCTACGHELRPGAHFCTACGKADAPAEPAAPFIAAFGSAPTLPPSELVSASPASSSPPEAPQQRSAPALAPNTPRRDESRRRPMWPVVLCSVVLVAGGAAAAVVLLLHPFGSGHAAPPASQSSRHNSRAVSISATSSSSPSATSTMSAEQQAAQSLAALLTQSVADRSSVVQAVSDVSQCGPNLSQDAQTFSNAASSRQKLLSQLANMPDSSALPQQMLMALTGAWQASAKADQDFAQWASDEISQGCTPNDHSDPGYQAAATPDAQATTDKQTFAGLWDPIATQYGLTPYQWDQL